MILISVKPLTWRYVSGTSITFDAVSVLDSIKGDLLLWVEHLHDFLVHAAFDVVRARSHLLVALVLRKLNHS